MADGAESLTLTAVDRIAAVAADAWDGCAGAVNPFVSHAFLSALEDSQAVAAETGWQPRHLTLTATDGRLMACAPVYLKSHSYGEYVFDWGWADAYERAGGPTIPSCRWQCRSRLCPAHGCWFIPMRRRAPPSGLPAGWW